MVVAVAAVEENGADGGDRGGEQIRHPPVDPDDCWRSDLAAASQPRAAGCTCLPGVSAYVCPLPSAFCPVRSHPGQGSGSRPDRDSDSGPLLHVVPVHSHSEWGFSGLGPGLDSGSVLLLLLEVVPG